MFLLTQWVIVIVSTADISGGHSSSILTAMRASIDASRAKMFAYQHAKDSKSEGYQPISHHHAFYMATLGGAKGQYGWGQSSEFHFLFFVIVLSLDDKIGSFEVCCSDSIS